MEQHDRATEHAPQPAQRLVPKIGGFPVDRIGPEHSRDRDGMHHLPPGVQRVGLEKCLQDAKRGRMDHRGDVQSGTGRS